MSGHITLLFLSNFCPLMCISGQLYTNFSSSSDFETVRKYAEVSEVEIVALVLH